MVLRPSVALFVDAPRLGAVKPGLAAEVGVRHALRLYRVVVARTLAAVGETGWRALVWYGPVEAGGEVRGWLGPDWESRPQASGDMGARLAVAANAVEVGRPWIALDASVPGLSPALLHEADRRVAAGEIVLGPTRRGGLYLVGGRAPIPDLLAGVTAWSADDALAGVRARLGERRLSWGELKPLHDMDSAVEARAAGLLT